MKYIFWLAFFALLIMVWNGNDPVDTKIAMTVFLFICLFMGLALGYFLAMWRKG